MKILKSILGKIQSYFVPKYRLQLVDSDLPLTLERNILYVVHEDGYLEHASMICPCGCKNKLHMNLIPDERPLWRLENYENGTVSLHPSVWRRTGCRSHFWLRNSRIVWCHDIFEYN